MILASSSQSRIEIMEFCEEAYKDIILTSPSTFQATLEGIRSLFSVKE